MAETSIEESLEYASGLLERTAWELERAKNNEIAAVERCIVFRRLFRVKRRVADKYGLALMMIEQGCAEPQRIAAEALARVKAAALKEARGGV